MELEPEKLEEIVSRVNPKARLAKKSQIESVPGLDTDVLGPDLESADLDVLRRRYLGDRVDAAADAEVAVPAEPAALRDEDDPVEQMADIEYDEGNETLQKTVLIDVEEGEIIAEQG